MNLHQEPYTNYTVNITDVGQVKQMARSEYEACDKAYTKWAHLQGDRTKYTTVKNIISLTNKNKRK